MIPRIGEIEKEILSMQAKKDAVMDLSREIIRLTGRCITLMHAREMRRADSMLSGIKLLVKKLQSSDKGFEYNSQQAYQEYVEAAVLHSILGKGRLPSDRELGVDSSSYLLGILDVVGELKREVFEALRADDFKRAESYYSFMADIHDSLLPLRFSSSLMPDFRKKQDVARIQLESVSGELLSFRNSRMAAIPKK